MANLKLKKQMIKAVDNQIKANDPPFVKEVYQQLQKEGSSKKEAKEMIASVLLGEMFEVLKYGKKFNEQQYKEELFALLYDEEDFLEDILDYVDDVEEDEILKVKHQVYDALYEHKPTEAVRIFLTVWEDVKKFVKDNFYKQDKNGNIIKPEVIDIDDQTDFKYELYNWLQDMEMEFQNSRLFEESIAYFQDVIDLFAWVEDSCDYYKAAIGEVYNTMGRYEE